MKEGKLTIKKRNDFVLGILMLLIGLYVMFAKNTVSHISKNGLGGFWARPDVYMKGLAGGIVLLSVILLIQSIGFVKNKNEVKPFKFYINIEILISTVLLFIYTLVLSKVGFFICTFLLVIALVNLFSYKRLLTAENPKKERNKLFILSIIYSLILVIVMYYVFTYAFGISLP
ncbi:MAG: tripartite tricarboxylate transporter TctB family protein [Sphaerochaeta sp.]